jgi:hypothetical protein
MPDSSVYVCHNGVARVTLVSKPTLVLGLRDTDYAAEAQQVLGELETQLELAGCNKAGLLEVGGGGRVLGYATSVAAAFQQGEQAGNRRL